MYKITYQVDVDAIASVIRYDGVLYVSADTAKGARDKAESFITSAYTGNFVILEVMPIVVID